MDKINFTDILKSSCYEDLFDKGISPERKMAEINYLINSSKELRDWEKQPTEGRKKWVKKQLEEMMRIRREKQKSTSPVQISKPVINATNQTSPTNQVQVAIPTERNYQFNLDRSNYAKEKAERAKQRKLAEQDLELLQQSVAMRSIDENYEIMIAVFDDWVKDGGGREVREVISEIEIARSVLNFVDICPTLLDKYNFVIDVLAEVDQRKKAKEEEVARKARESKDLLSEFKGIILNRFKV